MKNLQKAVAKISKKNGYDKESLEQKFMLLMEECGEFAKAVRKSAGIKVHSHSKEHNMEEEASDVLYVLCDICNKLKIDMEKEFKKKLQKIKNYKETK